MKDVIATTAAPAAIGPYSQAVLAGHFLFLSGQIPLDPQTGILIDGGIEEQTVRVLENLKAVLAAAGLTFEHVVKTTVFVKDLAEFGRINEIYSRYFGLNPPARSTVEVSRLPRDVRVEIDAIAVLP